MSSLLFYYPESSSILQQEILQQTLANTMTQDMNQTFRSIERNPADVMNFRKIFTNINELLDSVFEGEAIPSSITSQIDDLLLLAQNIFNSVWENIVNKGGGSDFVAYTNQQILGIEKEYHIKNSKPPSQLQKFKNMINKMGIQLTQSNDYTPEEVARRKQEQQLQAQKMLKLENQIRKLKADDALRLSMHNYENVLASQQSQLQRMKNEYINKEASKYLTQQQMRNYDRLLSLKAVDLKDIFDNMQKSKKDALEREALGSYDVLGLMEDLAVPEFDKVVQKVDEVERRRMGKGTGEYNTLGIQQNRPAQEQDLELLLDDSTRRRYMNEIDATHTREEDFRRTLNLIDGSNAKMVEDKMMNDFRERELTAVNGKNPFYPSLISDGAESITTQSRKSIEEVDSIIKRKLDEFYEQLKLNIMPDIKDVEDFRQEIPPELKEKWNTTFNELISEMSKLDKNKKSQKEELDKYVISVFNRDYSTPLQELMRIFNNPEFKNLDDEKQIRIKDAIDREESMVRQRQMMGNNREIDTLLNKYVRYSINPSRKLADEFIKDKMIENLKKTQNLPNEYKLLITRLDGLFSTWRRIEARKGTKEDVLGHHHQGITEALFDDVAKKEAYLGLLESRARQMQTAQMQQAQTAQQMQTTQPAKKSTATKKTTKKTQR